MERKLLDIKWRDRKQASWIRENIYVEIVLLTITDRKLMWGGHIMRRADNI